MRAAYLNMPGMSHVLSMLTPQNRLVCEIMLHTGLRVGDVLALRKEKIKPRMTIVEQKTGKKRQISLTADLVRRARGDGVEGFVFPHAYKLNEHRTRQAVWKDVTRAAKILRYKQVSPHSCRKVYAVDYYKAHGLEATGRALNHDRESTTLLYALADVLSSGAHRRRGRSKK